MDGRRRHSDDPEPRWDQREPDWPEPADTRQRDEDYRVPEPRAAGPEDTSSFDGFSAAARPWEQPTYNGEEPSWNSGPAAQLPIPIPPPTSAPPSRPQSGPPYGDQGERAYGGRPGAPPYGGQPQSAPPYGGQPQSAPPYGPPDRPMNPPGPVSAEPAQGPQLGPPPGQLQGPPPHGGTGPAMDTPTSAMPPVGPRDEAPRFHTEPIDRAALRRPGAAPAGDGVYRTKRPAAALLYGVLALIFEVVAVRIFLDGMFGGPFLAGQTMAGVFMIAGIPLLAMGLFGATAGAGRAESAHAAWLRAPGVYVVAGAALLISAGLAG